MIAGLLLILTATIVVARQAHQLPLSQPIRTFEQNAKYIADARARRLGQQPPRKHRMSGLGETKESLMARTVPRVPMVNYGDLVWVAEVYIGTPRQGPFRVVADSGSSNLWVPSVQCSYAEKYLKDKGCEHKTMYFHNTSTSYQPDACEALFIPYGTGFVVGYLSNDTINFGGVNVKQQEFGEAIYMADFFAAQPIDGILGLAFPNIASDGVTPVLDNMNSQGLLNQFGFGVYLSNKPGGHDSMLTLGANDPARFKGKFVWADVIIPSYWLVGNDNIYVNGKVVHHCLLNYCPMVIDTGTSILAGPPYIVDPIIKAIGDVKADCSNLKSLPTIAFNMGGFSGGAILPLEPDYYVIKVETSPGKFQCELGIESSIELTPLMILGDPFIRKYYSYFDRQNKRVGFALAVHT